MFVVLDVWLLDLTERFVKRFNWLTGKDNFWLAKIVWIFGFAFLAVGVYIWMFLFPILLFLGGIMVPLLGTAEYIFIRQQEIIADKSAMNGIKDLQNEISLQSTRRFTIISFVVYNIFFLGLPLILFLPMWLYMLCSIAINYIVSVDRPPFKRSMAVEWLKNKIRELSRSFQGTPSPQPA